jgi:diguanylate cyclase (GGDEF)-like protein/PAS domain S-box-containing protein
MPRLEFLRRHHWIYLRFTLLGLAVVWFFFFLQTIFVLQEFHFRMIVVPSLLGLCIGILLATLAALREEMQQRNQLFRAVADFAQEFTYFRRLDGRYEYVSPACEQLTGYEPVAFYLEPNFMDRLIHPDDKAAWKKHVHHMNADSQPETLQVRILTSQDEVRWISHLCSDVRDEQGKVIGVRSTNLDVTGQMLYQQQLRRLADYDPLTDLPNRRMLIQTIEELTRDSESSTPFAVLFLDLDHFKHLNDTYGHTFGDELLIALAARMRDYRTGEIMVARFGGDEFVIVVPDIGSAEAAAECAKDILKLLERPFAIRDQRFFITGSIGVSLCPHDSNQPEELIKYADVAMYRAKLDGRSTIGFYSLDLVQNAADFLDIETRLRDALDKGSLQLHYQPRIRLSDGALIGVEALARWQSGDAWISPARFIPVAEESGLIDRLTEQLLQQAAIQSLKWPDLRISFNLSGRQIRRSDLCEWINGVIEQAGSSSRQFELEVTEGILMNAKQDAAARLTTFRQMGYRVALDDFGTGFSSLSYLRDLPFDVIKLDGSFVRGMHDNTKDAAIVRAVATLCQEAGMDLVAEGIETEQQLATVSALGVTEGQGYLLARPMPASELDALIERGTLLTVRASHREHD